MRPWLAFAALLVFAPLARGEDPVTHRADEIVVEGEGAPPAETYQDTPVETEVMDRTEIQQRPGQTAADLVRALPGFREQQRIQGEGAAVSIEGMPAEYTRALVDGERYQGELGGVDDFSKLPLDDAERVEVLRGVQSLRYGSEAAGGVVKIETASPPTDGWRARLDAGAGNDGAIHGSGSIGVGNEQIGGWLRFVHDQIDGFDRPSGADGVLTSGGSQSQARANDVYGKLRFQPLPGLQLDTIAGWREDTQSNLASDSDLIAAAVGEGDSDERRWLAAQRLRWEIDETSRLSGSVGWYDDAFRTDFGRSYQRSEREVSGDLAYERTLRTGPLSHLVTVGVDAQAPQLALRESEALSGNGQETGPARTSASETMAGVFALTQTQILDSLTVEAGVRGQYHDHFGARALPQIALLWTPWRPDEQRFLRLRASWGLGWRTPSLRELYEPAVPQIGGAYFLAGNPDLQPESISTLRAGFELEPVSTFSISVMGFYNQMHDLIRSVADGTVQTGTE